MTWAWGREGKDASLLEFSSCPLPKDMGLLTERNTFLHKSETSMQSRFLSSAGPDLNAAAPDSRGPGRVKTLTSKNHFPSKLLHHREIQSVPGTIQEHTAQGSLERLQTLRLWNKGLRHSSSISCSPQHCNAVSSVLPPEDPVLPKWWQSFFHG